MSSLSPVPAMEILSFFLSVYHTPESLIRVHVCFAILILMTKGRS